MTRRPGLLVLLAATAASTEDLTIPGSCPDFCPPGEVISVDTVLREIISGDSAFRGYVQPYESGLMLAADVPGAAARAVFRTTALPSHVAIGNDSGRVVGIDSMQLQLVISRRDTSARGLVLAFHRLPVTLDSTTTFADLASAFAAPPMRTVAVDRLLAIVTDGDTLTKPTVDSVRVGQGGTLTLFAMFDSVQVAYPEADSGRLAIGVRAAVDTTAAAGRATVALGALDIGPVLAWTVHVDSQGTVIPRKDVRRGAQFSSWVVDPPPAALDTTRADSAAFARYLGVYRNDRTHAPLEVAPGAADRFRALPNGWYWLGNGRWHFDVGQNGKPAGLRIAQADGDTVSYRYVAERFWTPTPEQLRAFEGSYPSDEVGVTYRVKLAGDSLTLSPRVGSVHTLRPAYPDGFTSRGTTVWFTRDRGGRVTAMHLSESRVWDLVVSKTR